MGVSRAQRERVALRQQAVLDAYEVYGTIAKACEVASVPRSEHYRWLKGKRYAARFAEAEEQSIQALETEARRRALAGTERPLFHKGNQRSGMSARFQRLSLGVSVEGQAAGGLSRPGSPCPHRASGRLRILF